MSSGFRHAFPGIRRTMFHFRRHWWTLVTPASWGLRQKSTTFATGPRQYDGTFYEFRTYTIQPAKMNEFLENTNKHIHLRTTHSELIGYWRQEFGDVMNRVFHIWKYDDFAHRARVREALAKDEEWQEKYISPNLPFMVQQKNEIAYLVPWCKLEKPPKEGFYEIVTFHMKPGGPALWGEDFQRAVNTHIQVGYSKLVGVFHTEFGTLNRVHVLWWTDTPDNRAAGRHRAHEDARVVAAVRESCSHLESQENVFLIPLPFSPLK